MPLPHILSLYMGDLPLLCAALCCHGFKPGRLNLCDVSLYFRRTPLPRASTISLCLRDVTIRILSPLSLLQRLLYMSLFTYQTRYLLR